MGSANTEGSTWGAMTKVDSRQRILFTALIFSNMLYFSFNWNAKFSSYLSPPLRYVRENLAMPRNRVYGGMEMVGVQASIQHPTIDENVCQPLSPSSGDIERRTVSLDRQLLFFCRAMKHRRGHAISIQFYLFIERRNTICNGSMALFGRQ